MISKIQSRIPFTFCKHFKKFAKKSATPWMLELLPPNHVIPSVLICISHKQAKITSTVNMKRQSHLQSSNNLQEGKKMNVPYGYSEARLLNHCRWTFWRLVSRKQESTAKMRSNIWRDSIGKVESALHSF